MAVKTPTTEMFNHDGRHRLMLVLGTLFLSLTGCGPGQDQHYTIGENYRWEGTLFSAPVLVEISPGIPGMYSRANALFTSNGSNYRLYFTPTTEFSKFDEGRKKANGVWRVNGKFQEQRKILVESMKYIGEMSKADIALDDALAMNRLKEARDRIENGGDPNLAIAEEMLRSLCRHAAKGESESTEVIRAAVKAGANVNARGVDEIKPIDVVVRFCFDHTLVKELINAGAELNIPTPGDRSVLREALSDWFAVGPDARLGDDPREIERSKKEQFLVVNELLQAGAQLTASEKSCTDPKYLTTNCFAAKSLEIFKSSTKN